MAIIYCDSAGSGTSPYDTWAKAAANISTALGAWSTGDVIYVKSTATVGGTATETLSGGAVGTLIPIYTANASDVYTKATIGSPNIDCSDGGADIAFSAYTAIYGMTFKANDDIQINKPAVNLLTDCVFSTGSTNALVQFSGANGDNHTELVNCTITSHAGDNSIQLTNGCHFSWHGGSYTGTVRSVGLFIPGAIRYQTVEVVGVDFSGGTFSTYPLVDTSIAADTQFHYKFVNCNIPAGINIYDSFGGDGQFVELISTNDGGNVYDYTRHSYRSNITTNTSVYRTTGFQEGTQSLSHAITPTANLKDGAVTKSPLLMKYNSTTGSSQTITIYTADNFTSAPNANQAWIEVVTLNTVGEVTGTLGVSRPADFLATTALTTTTGEWTGTPGHQHKMTYSFTAQKAGWIGIRMVLGNGDFSGETANSFFYDPEINVA